MKKIIVFIICLLVLLCGCTSQPADNPDVYFEQMQNCDLYEDIIKDYRNIVSSIISDYDGSLWNDSESIELSDTLNQALTVSGSDSELMYRWSCSVAELPSIDSTIESFGYILTDINSDGCPELFWVRDDHTVLAVFTVYNNRVILLDAFWARYCCVVTDDGMLYTRASGGASIIEYEIRELSADASLTTEAGFSMYNDELTEYIDGEYVTIDNSRLDKLLIEYPFENSQRWLNTEIIPLFIS